MPVRIGQVTVSVVGIERVAAMHAGLDLRLGSHTAQGTRYGPKSVLISGRRRTIDVTENTWRAIQTDSMRQPINYFLKLTWPSFARTE
jgi:hypothetical protein